LADLVETTPLAGRDRIRDRAVIRGWLNLVAVMIVVMIAVGGATRLTDSGLSITEWQPVEGAIPPLSDSDWREAFARYQQIPEFRLVNPHMTLAEFRTIYWWEWAHRFLGRLIGIVVLLPMVAFWATGRLEPALKLRMVALFLIGGLQGAVGWWMVASGLTARTDVSQVRLAVHLGLAAAILAYVVWLARGLEPARAANGEGRAPASAPALIVALTLVQIFAGGLVAGLDAGLTFNTWPLMDGGLVPSGLLAQSPWWRNLFENAATVQFGHRLVAYLLLAAAIAHAIRARRTAVAKGASALAAIVALQAAIGVATLLTAVPLPLALMHQLGAVAVLVVAVRHLRAMRPPLAAVP